MAIQNYFERLRQMDRLIRRKATGSPKQFAQKLGISERTLYEYLSLMKIEGAQIEYSAEKQSYYYMLNGYFFIGYQLKEIVYDNLITINGGISAFHQRFSYCNNISVKKFNIA